MSTWRYIAFGYALLALIAAGLTLVVRKGYVLSYSEPWLALQPTTAWQLSAVLGVGFALFVIASSRVMVLRLAWAQRLQEELQPVAAGLKGPQIATLAVLSSLGEELLFRSLLMPLMGLVLSSALFGLAHQMRGPSRWYWAAWAALVGLGLGALFALTGSLMGCLLAHALINGCNLLFLRNHLPAPPAPPLGGLFRSDR